MSYQSYTDQEEVEYLKTISQEDLCKFFDEYIAGSGPKRCKLSVHVVPLGSKNGPGGGSPLNTVSEVDEDVTETTDAPDTTDTTDMQVEETDSSGVEVSIHRWFILHVCTNIIAPRNVNCVVDLFEVQLYYCGPDVLISCIL